MSAHSPRALSHLLRALFVWIALGAGLALASERVAVVALGTDAAMKDWIKAHPGPERRGTDPDVAVRNAAQLVGRAVQESGQELVPVSRKVLYHWLPAGTSSRGIEDFGYSIGITSVFLVSAARGTPGGSADQGYHLQISKLLLGRSKSAKPLAACAMPPDASVEQFQVVKECLRSQIEAAVKGNLYLTAEDSRNGQAVPSVTIEVVGKANLHSSGNVELEAGNYTIRATADGFMPVSMAVSLREGQDTSARLVMDARAAVVVLAPSWATVAIDGQSAHAGQAISVAPNQPLSLLVRTSMRSFTTTVQLNPGETRQVKARLRF